MPVLDCILGNFPGRKLSQISQFCGWLLILQVFSMKFGGMASFGVAKASNMCKSSLRKSYFSPICGSFLPQKFPTIRDKVKAGQQSIIDKVKAHFKLFSHITRN